MSVPPPTIHAFCQAVEQQLGLVVDRCGDAQLHQLLRERSQRLRLDAATYVTRFALGEMPDEEPHLSAALTIGETYFFRHPEQLHACCDLIRVKLRQLAGCRPVRILSAGCSSGEEPYSLAMLIRETLSDDARVEIVGLDISQTALQRARTALYSKWSLRETSRETLKRWFVAEGDEFRLNSSIRAAVTFVQGNLAATTETLQLSYDFVLCRNVLMYFSPKQFHRAAARLVGALQPDGYFFLGHAESLRGVPLGLELVHASGSFHYRRAGPVTASAAPYRPNAVSTSDRGSAPMNIRRNRDNNPRKRNAPPSNSDGLTTEASRTDAFSRIHHLASLGPVNELLRQERFSEALEKFEVLPELRKASPELQLCRVMLLIYSNRFASAEALVQPLLNDETVTSAAHYALAMCLDSQERTGEAVQQNRLAAYLDPTFAMPWFHLGIQSKRLGDLHSSRQALLQARALLLVEPTDRLLWFGGGCSRQALLDLCERAISGNGSIR